MSVRGRATSEVPPDFAVVHVAVEARDRQRGRALDDAAAAGATLREVLADVEGLREVALTGARVSELWQEQGDGGVRARVGFVATVTGTVECGVEVAGTVAQAVSSAGGQLRAVSWGLDVDNPAHRAVRVDAVGRAREAAEDFASAVGCGLGDLVTLADPGLLDPGGGVWGRGAQIAGAAGPGPELDLDPQSQTVTAAVEARYTLVPRS